MWDASSDWVVSFPRPFDREVQLRGRGDALANASAWGFMDNVAISTSAAGTSFCLFHYAFASIASRTPYLDDTYMRVSYTTRMRMDLENDLNNTT